MGDSLTLNHSEKLDWLRLSRSENIGPITFFQLIRRFGAAAAALDAVPDLARRGGRKRPIKLCDPATAEAEAAAIEKAGARLVAACEPEYPKALAAIADPPPALTVLGRPEMLASQTPTVGIVGARNASGAGRRIAQGIATDLGARGIIVASGLARGIDTAAHNGALKTGTVAVVAGGVDVYYPPENEDLQNAIAAEGAVISEQPMGTEPQARHFPRRNRMISGLSLGVLIVEAASRSGSLITARTALEQGREVFAVPGSPLDPRAQGTNHLLRQGATLAERADDIAAVIAAMADTPLSPLDEPEAALFEGLELSTSDEISPAEGRAQIIELVSPAPLAIDDLVRLSRLTPGTVMTILLELEIAGLVQHHPDNQVSTL